MAIERFISRAKEALQGEQGRRLLDKAEETARRATGGKHEDKIRKARDAADKALGNDDQDGQDVPRTYR